jgi:signal peptidase I
MDKTKPSSSLDGNVDRAVERADPRYSALALQISRSGESNGKPLRLKVISNSMAPQLKSGDAIEIEFATPESLKRGDIIVFLCGGDLVTHRLVSINPHACLTKGDSLLRFDAPVDRSDCLGRVIRVERDGFVMMMNSPRWRLFNRTAGALNYWGGQAASWGDRLFPWGRAKQRPASLSFLGRLISGLFHLPISILLKLLAQ